MVRSCVLHYYRMTRSRTSCAAVKAKGCPLPYVWALLDGTFRDFCRPCKGGYAGITRENALELADELIRHGVLDTGHEGEGGVAGFFSRKRSQNHLKKAKAFTAV